MQTNKFLKFIGAIGAAFAALLAWLFYERSKRKSAEGLLENQETKEKLIEKDKQINVHEANLEVEESKREELKKQMREIETNESIEELEKFFNNDPNKQ